MSTFNRDASQADLVEAFERDGYLVIEGALDRAEAERYRRRILSLLPEDLTLPSWWESRFGRIKPLHEDGGQTYDQPELLPIFQNEAMYEVVRQILRSDELRVFDGSIGITLRHDRGESPLSQRIHTDHSIPTDVDRFRDDLSELELGGCFYLTDVEPQGGGISLLPGGHRVVMEQGGAPGGRQLHSNWTDIKGLPDLVEITGRAGDFVLLHPLMPHAASHNRRETTRVVQFLRWVRMDYPHGRAERPRSGKYSDEQLAVLTPLGRRLLGVDPWHTAVGA